MVLSLISFLILKEIGQDMGKTLKLFFFHPQDKYIFEISSSCFIKSFSGANTSYSPPCWINNIFFLLLSICANQNLNISSL